MAVRASSSIEGRARFLDVESVPIVIHTVNIKGKVEAAKFSNNNQIDFARVRRERAREGGHGDGGGGEPITGDSISRGYLQLMYTRKPLSPLRNYTCK